MLTLARMFLARVCQDLLSFAAPLPWVVDAMVVAIVVGKVKAMQGTNLLSTSAVSTSTSFSASGSFAPTPTIMAGRSSILRAFVHGTPIRTILDGEILRRPLMGLNLASASIDSAALFLPKLASSLPQAQALLEKESLNEAVRYFNPNRDVERDSAASKEMCKTYTSSKSRKLHESTAFCLRRLPKRPWLCTPVWGAGGGRRNSDESGTRKKSWRARTAPDDALVTLRPPPTLQRLVALVQHDAGEKQNTKPVLVLLRVVVGGFHATKTARPTTTPWVGRTVAL